MSIQINISKDKDFAYTQLKYDTIFKSAPISIWIEDFSEAKSALDELAAQGVSDFRKYFDEHPAFLAQVAQLVKVCDVNDATLALYGVEKKEQLLGSLNQILAPESLRLFKEELIAIAEGKLYFEGEFISNTLHGNTLNILLHLVVPDEPPDFSRVIVTITDITQRVRMEIMLRRQTRLLESILESIGEGVVVADEKGDFLLFNPMAESIVGFNAKASPFEELSEEYGTFYPDKVTRFASNELPLVRAIEGQESDDVEMFVRNPPLPEGIYISVNGRPLKNKAGKIKGGLITFRDISERKAAQEALLKRTKELERSNQELEQFAYVASHDLQEPLRMISSYTQLLARRYKGQLDSDADKFINFAVDGAQRMQHLINDLLAYSRVGTRGQPFKPINCEIVLERVLANLAKAISENEAIITTDPLPTLVADARQLLQLFQNLISNAIKYRAQKPPEIHIGVKPPGDDGAWLFWVRDNGIGIEPQYAERIFIIFKRLHSRSEYPGTGIGLAICKKIVERHGGQIWVESELEKGATFYFTLSNSLSKKQ